MCNEDPIQRSHISQHIDQFRINTLLSICTEIEERIKLADSKAGILLSATGIIVGIGMNNKLCNVLSLDVWCRILGILFLISSLFSIIFFAIAILPSKRENSQSVLYFDDIIRNNSSIEYLNNYDSLVKEDKLALQIANDILELSRIASKKFKFIGYGIWTFGLLVGSNALFFLIRPVMV